MILDDIGGLIQANALGTPGTDLFKDEHPDDVGYEGQITALLMTGGMTALRTLDVDQSPPTDRHSMQVWVRSGLVNSSALARTRAEALHDLLDNICGQTIGTGFFEKSQCLDLPHGMTTPGTAGDGRKKFVFNVVFWRRRN